MNTYPVNISRVRHAPKVFAHNQKKFGFTVLIIQSSRHNDWNNPHTMKDLYNKGFYQ